MTSKVALITSRFIEAALIVLGVMVVVLENTTVWIACWDLLAVVYIATRIRSLRRARNGDSAGWLSHGLGGRAGLIFTIFTSLVGIIAGLMIVLSEDGDQQAAKLVGVPAIALAWAILHFGYAERYSKTYYGSLPEQVLVFPNTDRPTFIDFAYFSFTLGTTFSVSDVETQTSGMRLQILSHSILGFLYNTVTIAIAVSVISG
ncbi:DUF1345 domain-containing protein [Actinoplanes sp. TRM 88003]|uniref:DUF1345 domain-containing protein n=1 Tax=Paractinoplanes aksuensis TaxID=2939490 RepID=A0ABT1E037_9ACTN|nr:DUF1345 domain-containing protein [Actinoplanes aksuensis]MCO8275530.1 DUF1345 domain-containing protein [Actinoplanes aksuensis]